MSYRQEQTTPKDALVSSALAPTTYAAIWDNLPELTRAALRVRSRSKTPEEAREKTAKLDLAAKIQQAECDRRLRVGSRHGIFPDREAHRAGNKRDPAAPRSISGSTLISE